MKAAPLHQLTILDRIGVPVLEVGSPQGSPETLGAADLSLDALIGYNLRGAPREPIASFIRQANAGVPASWRWMSRRASTPTPA
jgi:NAD(P)H-hydrate repair Nnr-like enzyme with NAD(P)H-hydrate epimerase domain